MKIAVFGLGYIGNVTAACFAKLGHEVIGVDVVNSKIDSINEGKGAIKEKGLDSMIYSAVKRNKLIATKDTKYAVLNTDIAFVCVGTPSKRNGDIDLDILKSACKEIGESLKEKPEEYTVVIRSTMLPGSLDIVREIIEKYSSKKIGFDIELVANPEFLREGTAIKDFFEPPFVIVGADKKEVGRRILRLYEGVGGKKIIVKPELAQMIKYANNSFHALKITFANEIGAVCKSLGVDSRKLMQLFCEDDQLNISKYYLKPGFAYGGSCLPKDVAALRHNGRKQGLELPLIDSIIDSNISQIIRAIKIIEATGKKNIGILGITFKADTDDIRSNPILLVINKLINKKYNVKIYDSLINSENISSITRSYRKEVDDLINHYNLKEKITDISKLFTDIDGLLKQEVIVISNRDEKLREYLKRLSDKQIVIDLQNIFNKNDTPAKYISL